MNSSRSLFFFMAFVFSASSVWAGGDKVGNGGGGQACKDSHGRITSVVSYDLEEELTEETALGYHNLFVIQDNQPVSVIEQQVWEHIHTMFPEDEVLYRKAFAEMQARWKFVQHRLAFIPDVDTSAIQKNCKYAQIADWDDQSGNLYVDQFYFDKMSPLNQVALKFHEALYLLDRKIENAKDSSGTRGSVAALFEATNSPRNAIWNLDGTPSRTIECSTLHFSKDFDDQWRHIPAFVAVNCKIHWPKQSDYALINLYEVDVKRPVGSSTVSAAGMFGANFGTSHASHSGLSLTSELDFVLSNEGHTHDDSLNGNGVTNLVPANDYSGGSKFSLQPAGDGVPSMSHVTITSKLTGDSVQVWLPVTSLRTDVYLYW